MPFALFGQRRHSAGLGSRKDEYRLLAIVEAATIAPLPVPTEAKERELEMAHQLIEALSDKFEPERYRDEYRESVMDLVNAKAEGREFAMPSPVEETGKVIDLMAALEASLKSARSTGDAAEGGGKSR